MKRHPLFHTTSLVLCTALLVSYGCNKSDPAKTKPVVQTAEKKNPLDVHLTEEMSQQFKVESAQTVELAVMQKVSGRIEANEQRTTRIGSSITGRVTQVMAEVGDRVQAGQPLAKLASPELSNAQLSLSREAFI